ncbi:arginine N-succinyltransferase [Pseudomaricurvus sp.]|uniref:arginine N-succinyltransferase n=1 Tax=Pseudomaricurvus sp. TaxID=2004510 RepID=UPI003F6D5E98
MLVIRPVAASDHNDLMELARKAGKGMTSLPANGNALEEKITISEASFSRHQYHPDDYFLLVMEDLETNKVVGTAGVYSQTGARQAFYAYRLMSVTHYSHTLDKQTRSEMLHLTNDYTDCSEVGTLFLDPQYRGNGHWLAKARYLLMGQFHQRFQSHVIAELRGWVDENGESPFWNSIGKQFFGMDFDTADQLCGVGSNQFITDLMPKHPIYTCLLPKAAQEVLGKPNRDGLRAMELLQEEGFSYDNVVDIFDGGPLMKAKISQLKSVRRIDQGIALMTEDRLLSEPTLVATSQLQSFRVINSRLARNGNGEIKLSRDDLSALNVSSGALLRFIQR